MANHPNRGKLEIYLNSTTDFSIVTSDGVKRTVQEARTLWNAGHIRYHNLAFGRLVDFDFDLQRVKNYYTDSPR